MTKPLETQVSSILKGWTDASKRALTRGVIKGAAYTAAEIAEHLINSGAGPGALSRSFRAEPIEVREGTYSAWARSIGSAEIYAGIQNYGGIIRPRTRKALAIPIKGAGIAKGKWPRHFGRGELKLVPRRGRPALLVKELEARKIVARRGKNRIYRTWVKSIKPMYVLLRSVRIKPKHYLEAVAAKVAEPVDRIIAKAWREETSK